MNKSTAKNIRIGLLAAWLILGAALLLLIQYANIHVEMQNFVTKLVWTYLFGVPVVIGVMTSLKRKLNQDFRGAAKES